MGLGISINLLPANSINVSKPGRVAITLSVLVSEQAKEHSYNNNHHDVFDYTELADKSEIEEGKATIGKELDILITEMNEGLVA